MSFLWSGLRSWLSSVLQSLGFAQKQATIVLLGLDNAGKTTLQWKLKTGRLQQFAPTQRAKEEVLVIDGLQIRAWDLGGHQAARQLWTKYCAMADGIVVMVDANEPTRFPEAAQELGDLVRSLDSSGSVDVPIAVFFNKSELKTAIPLAGMQAALHLSDLVHPRLQSFAVSVVAGTGYTEGFRWLASQCQ